MKNLYLLIAILFASFTSHAQAGGYCIPTYSTVCNSGSTNDLINNFSTTGGITNISNLNSGCNFLPNNYQNTGMMVVTSPGATIGFSVQCGAIYQQGFSIWIDWNQDLDFNDPGEKVYESPNSGFNPFTGTFTVPANATCSEYRMRVRSEYATGGANILPCDNQTYGETEDYTVKVDNCSHQEHTICLGETKTIDYTSSIPANTGSVVVNPMTNVVINMPTINFSPLDTTVYVVTWTSPDSSWADTATINVNTPLNPTYAGVDDTVCTGTFMALSASLANTNTTAHWSFVSPAGVGSGFLFLPNNTNLSPTIVANNPGFYKVYFNETDTAGVCPPVKDSLTAVFSTENHTKVIAHPTCNGYTDGSINITSFGTIGAVEYSIDNGVNYQTSNFFGNLGAGTYNVVSRDAAGCTFTSVAVLIDPLPVILTLSADTTVCENGTATHTANAINGTFFNYNWSHTPSFSPVQSILPISDSTVSVYALNQNTCSSDTLTVTTYLYDPITFTLNYSDTSVCPGDNSTALNVTQAAGGLNGYDFAWTANGNLTSAITSIYTAVPSVQTTYCVTVTDACETTPVTACKTYTMNQVPVADFDALNNKYEACVPGVFGLFVTTDPSLVGNVVWTIEGKKYNSQTPTHTFYEAGTYNVTLYVESSEGCKDEITKYAFFEAHPIPDPEFYISPNPTTMFNPTVDLTNLTIGSYTYYWEIPFGTPDFSTAVNQKVAYPDGVPAKYPVTLTATSDFGCTNFVSHEVVVESDVIIYAPNVFTPNQDKFNQNWRVYIEGIDVYDYNLKIFNKWGEIVWESFDAEASWDGTMLSGDHVMDGTYVWAITAIDISVDKRYEFKGTVLIMK